MATDEQAQAAIQALNGQEFNGRALVVNEAKPRESRPGGGGGGGRVDSIVVVAVVPRQPRWRQRRWPSWRLVRISTWR